MDGSLHKAMYWDYISKCTVNVLLLLNTGQLLWYVYMLYFIIALVYLFEETSSECRPQSCLRGQVSK